MENKWRSNLSARVADLRCMLDSGDDEFEGIEFRDAVHEAVDILEAHNLGAD